MLDLLITMLERLGIIVTVAFILTRLQFFQDMIHQDRLSRKQEFTAMLFFGFFGILGTYFGVAFNTETLYFDSVSSQLAADEAIANSRVIGIVIAGLLGGSKVGIGAGLIAGVHRFTLGGFTAFSCGSATILAGYLAGLFRKKGKHVKLTVALGVGAMAETIQMGVILGVAKPFEKALVLVETIGIPMIVSNGIGAAIFLLIVQNIVSDRERTSALQAQTTLRIADQTLGYLRNGMDTRSALAVCNILYREIMPTAVAMTNKTKILAHVGIESDHHRMGMPLQTDLTKEVIQSGKLVVVGDEAIHCVDENCRLGAAVIAPLKHRQETIGTLKLYFRSRKEITNVTTELVSGLSTLLSNQLEIAEADRAYQLAKEAEIRALQAQISPHFLFNSINTIVSLIRIEPSKARKLLLSLSHFLRQNLTGITTEEVTVEQELAHVKAYLEIESTRFVDKLKIEYDIDEAILAEKIPPLTLQPIVENAIKHGISDMDENCQVTISIKDCCSYVKIIVEDNGRGMEAERIAQLGIAKVDSETGTGLGLYNVNRRLLMTFGEKSGLHIESNPGKGTCITFEIPKREENYIDTDNPDVNC